MVAEHSRHPTIYLRASWPARGPEGEARGASEQGTVLEVPGGPGGGRVRWRPVTATFFTNILSERTATGKFDSEPVQNREPTIHRYIDTSIPTRGRPPTRRPRTVGVDGAKVFALSAAAPSTPRPAPCKASKRLRASSALTRRPVRSRVTDVSDRICEFSHRTGSPHSTRSPGES